MALVRLKVTHSECRCGYCKTGDEFIIGDVCPPLCMELWHAVYPYVFALRNGASLDYGDMRTACFDAQCPDGGRVHVHGEAIEE